MNDKDWMSIEGPAWGFMLAGVTMLALGFVLGFAIGRFA